MENNEISKNQASSGMLDRSDEDKSFSRSNSRDLIDENASKSVSDKLLAHCAPILHENHTPGPDSGRCDWVKYALMCPPHGRIGNLLTWILVILTVWAVCVSIFGQVAKPGYDPINIVIHGGTVFSLIVLVTVAYIGGWLVSLIKLPPLLGMLLVGILLKNVPYIDVGRGLDPDWSSALRSAALTVILLRAGLGLDPVALKQLSIMVFRLAFSPCLAETVVVAIASHLLLGFPWLWGFMLGFALAAVSPAVVVPCLLTLQEGGYGVEKGIPTLVIAAASVDDVLAISAFTILLGITFKESNNIAMLVLQGPLEALIGIVWGVAWGLLMIYLPPGPKPNVLLRVVLILGGGLFALFGSQMAGVAGSGALAVLAMSFVAGLGWRKQGWGDDNPVSDVLAKMWLIFQPLLFGLIGTEIKVAELDSQTVGLGILVLVCGLAIRIVVSYLAVFGGDLNHRERLFVALAWLPKATVQAAVGPLALDLANQALKEAGEGDDISALEAKVELGKQVLTIAVLVILITAPVGAVAVMTMGPRLLKKLERNKDTRDNERKSDEMLESGIVDEAKE